MPVVRNILHIQGGASQAAALLDFIADRRYGRGSIDLNRITPMPPWVYRQPTNMELLRKYGEENCSRGWCLKHWGVDQNVLHPEHSVRQYDGGPAIRFETMDGDVRELIRKLSLVFKELYLDYLWASEDVGSLVGAAQYRDGEPLIEFIPTPGSRAAIEKALDILGGKASDYGSKYCKDSPTMEEGPLQQAILRALNSVMGPKEVLIERIGNAIRQELAPNTDDFQTLTEIDRSLEELQSRFQALLEEVQECGGDFLLYQEEFMAINEQMTALQTRRAQLLEAQQADLAITGRLQEAESLLAGAPSEITEWDEALVRQTVETVKVLSAHEILVCLKGGMEIRETVL